MARAIADGDFWNLLEEIGPTRLAKKLGVTDRAVYGRRARLEERYGRQLTGPAHQHQTRNNIEHPQRSVMDIKNGVLFVGSDGHYWPGKASTVHRALVKLAREMKPVAFVFNGDAFDGARISRHPPIGWEKRPELVDELHACQERLTEIDEALPTKAARLWTLGNHDARFETRLAIAAPEYARINGVHLKDHFPKWEPSWSVFVNDDLVIKHRFKGGLHAPLNNSLWSGRSMVTGHLHSAKVHPLTDYNGTRYGVDTGCIADPDGEQFMDYREDSPANWRSAFGVFTFKNGVLLQPELVLRWDKNHVQFRGEIIRV